jgi:hypothetical protein
MKIRFLDVAQQELNEAITYFNDEVPNLGDDFLGEVLKTLDRTCLHREPDYWRDRIDN